MQSLLTRASTDPGSASQLLQSLTSTSSVPRDLLPQVLQFLASASGEPLPTRQTIFVVITAECDSNLVPVRTAADVLARLLAESTSTGVPFYDNNALFRCLVSLVSVSSGASIIASTPELDHLLVAVCRYHRIVSLQFIDVCSKLELISEAVLGEVVSMLCCCALESSRPHRVIGILMNGALQERCARLLLDYVADITDSERCRGAIALLADALWGPSCIGRPSSILSDALLNQMALLVRRDAIGPKIALEICNALSHMTARLTADDVADHVTIAEIVADLGPVQAAPILDPALTAILTALLAQSQAEPVLELAARHVHRLAAVVDLDAVLAHQQAKVDLTDPLWREELRALMRAFVADRAVPEPVRHGVLASVLARVERYRGVFSDEIVRHGLLPFGAAALDGLSDAHAVAIRARLGSILGAIAVDTFGDLLEIVGDGLNSSHDAIRDVTLQILVSVFEAKLPDPLYEHCMMVFETLVMIIRSHSDSSLRRRAIHALSGIGAGPDGSIRYVTDHGAVIMSSYIFAGRRYLDSRTSTILPVSELIAALLHILGTDSDHDLLDTALDALHHLCSDTIIAAEIDVPLLYDTVSRYVGAGRPASAYRLLLCLLSYDHRIAEVSYGHTIQALMMGLSGSDDGIADLCLQGLSIIALIRPDLLSGQVSEILVSCANQRRRYLQFLHTFLTELHHYDMGNRSCSISGTDLRAIFTLTLHLLSDHHLDRFESRLAYRCLRLSYTLCTIDDKRSLFDQNEALNSDDIEMRCLIDFMHTHLYGTDHTLHDDDTFHDDGKQRSLSWITPVSIVTIATSDDRPDAQITFRGTATSQSRFLLRSLNHQASSSAHILHLLKTWTGSMNCSCIRGLDPGEQLERSLSILDQIPCHEMIKVGIVYVRYDQTEESAILNNVAGSVPYQLFLKRLGRPLVLKGTRSYTGGLDRHDDIDGRLALTWTDSLTEICYHVATMIPNRSVCAQGEHKKRHIGNDFVNIVYLDDIRCQYDPETLSSQLNFVQIVVAQLNDSYFSVRFHAKPTVPEFWSIHDWRTIHISAIGPVIRQLIIQAQIACWTMQPQKQHQTAWQVRYQQIQRIAGRHSIPDSTSSSTPSLLVRI